MRRIANQLFVMGVLLALMIGLDTLKAGGTDGAQTLTLAAIGFVVLCAFTVAELGSLMTLPRVTGYILTGLALGPFAADILSSAVVQDIRMFNDLALGLIATSAGLELDGRAILARWKTFAATVGLKVLLIPLMVGGTFIALDLAYDFLKLQNERETIAMAAVFSALCIGTSPSISIAVLNETKAKGALSELTLGHAVLKDVVVVVCLAVAAAFTVSLTEPGGGLSTAVFLEVGKHLGEEVLLGIALAVFLVLYMRFVGAEMLIFVGAMILVVTQITEALHLQPLLVFITAGFVVRNFTRYEHTLLHPLQMVALPVFVVFFTNAGASVDIDATLAILPFAFAIAAVRALTFFVAARVGSTIGGERPVIRKVSWLAYLPLAGVTLGLVQIAARQLPAFSETILNTGMAIISINLLVGPITLRLALRAAGEIPEPGKDAAQAPGTQGESAAVTLVRRPQVQDPTLQAYVDRIEAEVEASLDRFARDVLVPWSQRVRAKVLEALPTNDDVVTDATVTSILALVRELPESDPPLERAASFGKLYEDLRRTMQAFPLEIRAPYTERNFAVQPTDSAILRLRRKASWVAYRLGGRRGRRCVPVRMACRMALEPRLAEGVRDALGMWCRTEASALAELRQAIEGNRGVAEVRSGLDNLFGAWSERLLTDLRRALSTGLSEFAAILEVAGTPEMPATSIRFSRVEPLVTRLLQELDRDGRRWGLTLVAAGRTVVLSARVELLQQRTIKLVESGFLDPLAELMEAIHPEIVATRDRLQEARRSIEGLTELDTERLESLAAACRKAFPQEAHVIIKRLRGQFREQVSTQRLASELHGLVEEVPESLQVLGGEMPLHFVKNVADVEVVEVAIRRLCEEALIVDLLPVLDERVRSTSALITVINAQLREHVSVAMFAIDTALGRHADEEEIVPLVVDGLERSWRRVDEMANLLERVRDETPEQVLEGLAHAFSVIRGSATKGRTETVQRRSVADVLRRRLSSAITSVASFFGAANARIHRLMRRLRAADLGQELQLRAGRTKLDAAGMRELLSADERQPDQDDLPPIYARLFSPEPVHDRRLFTARRNDLRLLLREEQAALEGKSDGVLLVGEHGSGRTSMLNVAAVEFRALRVIRLSEEHTRPGGFFAALAAELQCEPKAAEIRAELASTRTSVVVDDLERWFVPDPQGLPELERILDLVLTTRHVAFWVAAIAEDALEFVDPIFALRQAFGRVITLGPLEPEALARAVETRNKVSGLRIAYPRPRFAALFGDREAETSRARYYRNLARISRGNLRAALRCWYRDVQLGEGDTVVPRLRGTSVASQRILGQLHPHALAVLVQGLRFGVLDVEPLRRTLGLSRSEVSRHLAFLRSAGFLDRRSGFSGGLRINPAVQPLLGQALTEVGALRRPA